MSYDLKGRLREGYRRMSERVHQLLQQAGNGVHTLEDALHKASEQAHALGELSREEAELVAEALKRDVEELALGMMQAEAGIKDWADTDLSLSERMLLERALSTADPATLEWLRLKAGWAERDGYSLHAGMKASPGAYECQSCGEVVHLEHEATLPPCPHCKGTRFRPIPSAVM